MNGTVSRRQVELRHLCASFATFSDRGSEKRPPIFIEGESMKRWWYLILPTIVFLVSCCDLWVTMFANKNYRGFREANPIARYVWETHGDVGLVVFKLTVTFVSCICMGLVLRYKKRPWRIAVSVFGLSWCLLLAGWWIFWFFLEQPHELFV